MQGHEMRITTQGKISNFVKFGLQYLQVTYLVRYEYPRMTGMKGKSRETVGAAYHAS